MTCIFCKKPVDNVSVEHILPESLGGKQWVCLPPGVVCSGCNQYFGSKVEAAALDSFPFLPLRLILGIPTKKGKPAVMDSHLGQLRGSLIAGSVGLDPGSREIEHSILQGDITQIRILAELTEPLAVMRLLLKMGLETLALHSQEFTLTKVFDRAREFARAPKRGSKWWFLMHTNHEKLFGKMQSGVTKQEWAEEVSLETKNIEGAQTFVLRFLGITVIAPLSETELASSMRTLSEPEYRLFEIAV